MALELHVWGPAFALPSADPECLAVIFYLSYLSRHATPLLPWVLIQCHDPSVSHFRRLPALHNPETSVTVGGFQNVVSYLKGLHATWGLDSRVCGEPLCLADLIAFTSHVTSLAPPLLDLSLFVSRENYVSVTRAAYSATLSQPLQLFIVPELRRKAVARTTYLNLSSLALEDDTEKRGDLAQGNTKRQYDQGRSLIPESLRQGKNRDVTLKETLKAEQASERFRLEGLVDQFCEPLSAFLGRNHKYLLHSPSWKSEEPTSLDCLTAGYLAVMLEAEVPQAWLREGIRDRHPVLATYTQSLLAEFKGESGESLPWQDPSTSGLYPGARNPLSRLALYGLSRLGSTLTLSPSLSKVLPSNHDPNITTIGGSDGHAALGEVAIPPPSTPALSGPFSRTLALSLPLVALTCGVYILSSSRQSPFPIRPLIFLPSLPFLASTSSDSETGQEIIIRGEAGQRRGRARRLDELGAAGALLSSALG